MPKWTLILVVLLAAVYTACGGGSGSTGPSGSSGGTGQAGGSDRGGGGSGGEGAGGGGQSGSSLSTTRFRSLQVTVTPEGGGTVSDNFASSGSAIQGCATCAERYRLGTQVVWTASAAPGFVFLRWRGGDCDGSTEPTCALTIGDSTTVTAVFR